MTLEEILLDSLEKKDNGIDIKLSMERKFLSYFITLEVGGEVYNVYAEDEAKEGVLKGSLLKNLGLSPKYRFVGDVNRYSFRIKNKRSNGLLPIAVSTASSAAAFGSNMYTSQKKYGIEEKLCSFGIPLGVVMFKPIAALNYMIQCMFFAQMYHLKVSALWIVIMIVTCVILSVATTPIPGGGMAIYAVIFTQLGIPSEALAIALACESVFDFIITGLDQFGISLMLLNQAGRLSFVNREILLKNNDK